jgi:hypothetical protein
MATGLTNRVTRMVMRHGLVICLGWSGAFAGIQVAHAAEQTGSIAIRPDSPEQYTVVDGDTLWDIAGRFLEEPWMWPEVWQVNPQIANPDLIYPGDLISLTYVDGEPVLTLSRNGVDGQAAGARGEELPPPPVAGLRTERLSPRARRESILSPIPAIPLQRISAFLSDNSVVARDEYESAPYVLAETDGRSIISTGNEVYARGEWSPGVSTYDIVREGKEYTDPDTGALLGVEAILVGTATIKRYSDERAIMSIDSSLQDIRAGDRLVVHETTTLDSSYLPRPPAFDVDAAIASIGSGKIIAGQYDTLVLNRGSSDGLQTGHLLTVQEPGVQVEDEVGKVGVWRQVRHAFGMKGGRQVEFPGEDIASVLIYRVYDDVSLGIVLESTENVSLNDRVATP